MSEESTISWRAWGDEAFAEARAADKPVLLDIGAVWCHWCHVMDSGIPGDPDHTGTYSDPQVQARIAQYFIPIKVDTDRRPDINARYNMGGWPTTVFLTPDGDPLYGETYVPPPRMIALLDYMANLWANSRDSIEKQTQEMREQREAADRLSPSPLDPDTAARVLRSIEGQFDSVFGGFGTQPKFPHPDALMLTLEEYARTGAPRLREIAEKTLHGMADGGMYDRYAGGFFRYSTTRDWSVPHFEKMLEDNAKLTAVYALASQVLDNSYYLEVVKSAHGWLFSEMRSEAGAFAGSQDADREEAYYGQPLAVRAALPTPFIDRTVYTGWNALMVSSLVARFQITGEEEILQAAQKTFAFLHRGDGASLPHCFAEGVPQSLAGLLEDQTPMLQAALDLFEATGDMQYRDAAVLRGRRLRETLEDADGGFLDSIPDPAAVGELARPKKDIGDNADAALALLRLSAVTEEGGCRESAERALELFADTYADIGYFASSYARAVQAAAAPVLHVTVVGDRREARTQALLRAAWAVTVPGKFVETLEANAAQERGLPPDLGDEPYATVCIGTVCFAPTARVEEMRAQMQGAG